MSASLILFIPLALLGVVTGLCFVGCVFQTGGVPGADPGPYRDAVTSNSNLIAFWPLDDAPPTDPTDPSAPVARDNAAPPGQTGHDGTYKGTFTLRLDGIVTGDHPAVGSAGNPCASFDVGLVDVPFSQALNPATSFTLECWVQPNWTSSDSPRAVVVSANADQNPNPTANAGYALIATPTNWSAQVGIGTTFVSVTNAQSIVSDGKTTYYLAMTFENNALSLFVGVAGAFASDTRTLAATERFQPEQPATMTMPSTATSLFIAMGRPDIPTTNQYPFDGLIQDVAFYSPALQTGDLQNHFTLGSQGP
jgi:Concanavalin A-like lectin/glucanases superfamily